jgi:hypothetical protein
MTAAAPAIPSRPPAPDPAEAGTAAPRAGSGADLAFVLGPFRSGTTLLRKILDSHPRIASPAETWFLLPLLNLWTGDGQCDRFNPRQAAAALRTHLDRGAFLDCCRAFAERFYARLRRGAGAIVVDKTPLYLGVAGEIANLLPATRFLLLARDPRAILWSRATWRHAADHDPESHVTRVAADVRDLAAFLRDHADRSLLVRYERLCDEPAATLARVTAFLGVPFDESMIAYGARAHHEGYGDESTLAHRAPHTDSIARWRGGLSAELQARLLEACGADDLALLGLADLAVEPGPAAAPRPPRAATKAIGRVLFFTHAGTNSRDHLLDMARGFRRAGCEVVHWELDPIMQMTRGGARTADALMDSARILSTFIRANGVDLSVGMWGNALGAVAHGAQDGAAVPFFDLAASPHVMVWFDAPHWAHQGTFHPHFGTPIVRGRFVYSLVNDAGIAADMAGVLGFSNVLCRPWAVDEERFAPPAGVTPRYDLVFALGPGAPAPTPLMLRELESDAPDEDAIRRELAPGVQRRLREEIAPALAGADRDAAVALLDRLVDLQLARRHAPMIERLAAIERADAALAAAGRALRARPSLYVKAGAIVRELESWRRAFAITWLSRRFRCAVFSSPTIEGWPCAAEALGWVRHEDQARTYALGRCALNVMRWQDDVGLNLKPFEIAASGALCLCERRAALAECFAPDEEIVAFDTIADAAARLRDLLASPADLARIARAGCERVRRDHTWPVRARQIMDVVARSGPPAG